MRKEAGAEASFFRTPSLLVTSATLVATVDFVGEGSGVYESKLKSGREITIKEMMAAAHSHRSDAVVGIDMDRKTIDLGQSMMMICASSTAVALEPGGE